MSKMFDLNYLGKLICEQAEEKGWGHTKETLSVPEKMILISTEVTELEEARISKTALPKDTMASEYADILTRTLHLGTAWGVDFNENFKYKSKLKSTLGKFNVLDLLYFHNLVAKGYESWRHKKISGFKKYLYKLAHEVVELSRFEGVDIVEGSIKKMEINRSREWTGKKLNGSYK